MTVSVGAVQFDRVHYDAEADVLYLNVDGVEPVTWEESREGHFLRFDPAGELCGMTLVDVGHQLENQGTVVVTLPCAQELKREDLALALAS